MSGPPALELRGITRRFGRTLALDGVNFTLERGQIHALLGENGAGKSTLMSIVGGLFAPDAGTINVEGRSAVFSSGRDAGQAGIGMVHQHFLLVPAFTVAENLALAARDTPVLWNRAAVARRAGEVLERIGWHIPMDARVAELPVGMQQRVEIVKALLGNARILLFDEPTAVLAPSEVEELFGVLRVLREEGRSLVFVSHKLNEVISLCDAVTVLRRGRNVGTVNVRDTSPQDLANRMVGTEVQMTGRAAEGTGEREISETPRLAVTGLRTQAQPGAVALRDVSLHIAPGEILGVAGVDGNGQTELAQALTGLRPWTAGTVALDGAPLPRIRPQDLARLGIGLIPPDRQKEGLALPLTVAENLTLEAALMPQFRRGPFLNRPALRRFAAQTAQEFDVRAESMDIPVSALSGGNQQKIVIARALWRRPRLLIAVSPTRGLDVAATAYVHDRLRERQRDGGAILLISTELDEILALSTQIAALYEGRVVGVLPAGTPRETLGLMMGGRHAEPI